MDPESILGIYAILVMLLPARYRDEFGDEMEAVFLQALSDASEAGSHAVFILILREIRDLPRLALYEHWQERKRPPYISPASIHREPLPAWSVLASLSVFLAPILLQIFPQSASINYWLVFCMLTAGGLLLFSVIRAHHGFIPWALPGIGLVGGIAGLRMIHPIISSLQSKLPPAAQMAAQAEFFPQLLRQIITPGIAWLCMIAAMLMLLAILAAFTPFRQSILRLRQDPTHLAYMIYGGILLLAMYEIDGLRGELGGAALICLALAIGAWLFLRVRSNFLRVTALLIAATFTLGVICSGRLFLAPTSAWPVGFNGNYAEKTSRFAAPGIISTWIWTITALLSPWWVRRRPPVVLINLALCVLWLSLFRPIFPYLKIIFSRQEFRLNQLALAGVIGLLIYQVRHAGLKFHFGSPPVLHLPALVMLLGSSGLFVLAERLVDINTLSASLFGLALYGLVGLWLDSARWRQGLPAALLLIGTLPFGEHLQTFVGYPMRLLTAVLVRDGLAAFGVPSIGVDTILVFENGISQVDLPCSGIKSLWTGGMFLLAATWIERRRFNRRWLIAAFVYALLLFIANLARVAVLITVGQALGLRLLAEMLHVPLGVLGFCGASLALIWLLRCFVPIQPDFVSERSLPAELKPMIPNPRWLSPVLFASIILLAGLYTPRPEVAAAQAAPSITFAKDLSTEPWAFSPGEMAWLSADGPLAASRWRFHFNEYRGSLLLITSNTWRAHHRPERCFEAYGLTVNQSRSLLVADDFPVRQLSLSAGKSRSHLTAIYWLQSERQITDDYATRIWSDLSPERQAWVLVTILFDQTVQPSDSNLLELYLELRQSVARSLKSGGVQ